MASEKNCVKPTHPIFYIDPAQSENLTQRRSIALIRSQHQLDSERRWCLMFLCLHVRCVAIWLGRNYEQSLATSLVAQPKLTENLPTCPINDYCVNAIPSTCSLFWLKSQCQPLVTSQLLGFVDWNGRCCSWFWWGRESWRWNELLHVPSPSQSLFLKNIMGTLQECGELFWDLSCIQDALKIDPKWVLNRFIKVEKIPKPQAGFPRSSLCKRGSTCKCVVKNGTETAWW